MSFVTNVLTPIIQAIVYLLMIVGFFFFLYLLLKMFVKNVRPFIKYKVFRRNYQEKDVAYVMKAIEMGISPIQIKKKMLIKGYPKNRIEEVLFIYNEVMKKK